MPFHTNLIRLKNKFLRKRKKKVHPAEPPCTNGLQPDNNCYNDVKALDYSSVSFQDKKTKKRRDLFLAKDNASGAKGASGVDRERSIISNDGHCGILRKAYSDLLKNQVTLVGTTRSNFQENGNYNRNMNDCYSDVGYPLDDDDVERSLIDKCASQKSFKPLLHIERSTSDYQTVWKHKCILNNEAQYLKFIPVKDSYGDFYPKTEMDLSHPNCWIGIQSWYLTHRARMKERLRGEKMITRCKSDSDLLDENTSYGDDSDYAFNASLKCSINTSGGSTVQGHLNLLPNMNYEDIKLHPRFGPYFNERYCNIASINSENAFLPFEVEFVLEAPLSTIHLLPIISKLITPCLNSFFFPYKDAAFSSVFNLYEAYPHIFNRRNIWDLVDKIDKRNHNIKAILFVSERASLVLRHEHMCFLDTLAVAADICRDELLVLHHELQNDWYSYVTYNGSVASYWSCFE